jgi:hypothetical protein
MKRAFTLSAAVTAVALLLPNMVQAQNTAATESQTTPTGQSVRAEALGMVSARVALTESLDANKAKAGDPIQTKLSNNVALKNGPELPKGTVILGVIAQDDMQMSGTSKLALNFTQAKLKDGTVVPIKATIVGIFPPESEDIAGHPIAPGDQVRGTFAGQPDGVDQMDALPGVDVHSKIESNVSGVLVSSKHDVKIVRGSEIALGVAPQTTVPQMSPSSN